MKRTLILSLLLVACIVAGTIFSGAVVNATDHQVSTSLDFDDVEAGSATNDQLAVIIDHGGYYSQAIVCDQSRRELRRERRAIRRLNRSAACDLDAGSCARSFRVYEFSACDADTGSCAGNDRGSCDSGRRGLFGWRW